MNKRSFMLVVKIFIAVIIALIIVYFITKPNNPVITDEEIVKCIGEKSILYTQLGCHACETQEKMFGENYKYLNEIDCFYETDKCQSIEVTPTWKIKGKDYKGVQSIETLQELTDC